MPIKGVKVVILIELMNLIQQIYQHIIIGFIFIMTKKLKQILFDLQKDMILHYHLLKEIDMELDIHQKVVLILKLLK